ncbi:hypothetical protein DERP_013242 [Dermatophagoides pteronyssinus]|uniref:Uncharacterized protein n=1 Tax=Dermatophagoides pteronyssinus TaxID=6956 RepID=A0ABQ8IRW7_DERPT|nr:hypothetical protein DERP_013242 [Dermatophagoides pteronyssinus]
MIRFSPNSLMTSFINNHHNHHGSRSSSAASGSYGHLSADSNNQQSFSVHAVICLSLELN